MSSAPTVNASSQEAHICPTKKLYKVHPTFENCPLDWESNTSTEYNNKSKDTRTKVVLARILEKQGLGGTPDQSTVLRKPEHGSPGTRAHLSWRTGEHLSGEPENISMFSTCSELFPRAPIPDGRMERIMQPWPAYITTSFLGTSAALFVAWVVSWSQLNCWYNGYIEWMLWHGGVGLSGNLKSGVVDQYKHIVK